VFGGSLDSLASHAERFADVAATNERERQALPHDEIGPAEPKRVQNPKKKPVDPMRQR
jgi:hypothetical protein